MKTRCPKKTSSWITSLKIRHIPLIFSPMCLQACFLIPPAISPIICSGSLRPTPQRRSRRMSLLSPTFRAQWPAPGSRSSSNRSLRWSICFHLPTCLTSSLFQLPCKNSKTTWSLPMQPARHQQSRMSTSFPKWDLQTCRTPLKPLLKVPGTIQV